MKALKKERDQVTRLNRRQLVKNTELNTVRHDRQKQSQQNTQRTRAALQVVADEYKAIKLSFVSGTISKDTMTKAHQLAAQKVANIRENWKDRQAQIDAIYENAIARTITMENIVDSDQAKGEAYFNEKAEEIKARYGKRIKEIMMTPIVSNFEKLYGAQVDAASKEVKIAGTKTAIIISGASATAKADQKNSAVCPLYQD